MRPATKPLVSTLWPEQSQPQLSFATICGAGAFSSTRSLTFRTLGEGSSIHRASDRDLVDAASL